MAPPWNSPEKEAGRREGRQVRTADFLQQSGNETSIAEPHELSILWDDVQGIQAIVTCDRAAFLYKIPNESLLYETPTNYVI